MKFPKEIGIFTLYQQRKTIISYYYKNEFIKKLKHDIEICVIRDAKRVEITKYDLKGRIEGTLLKAHYQTEKEALELTEKWERELQEKLKIKLLL